METGYATIAGASAVLFGLIIVALEFASSAALSRIDKIGEVRGYSHWIWAAGLNICIYYMYAFAVSIHMLRTRFSFLYLLIITAVASFFMILTKILDVIFLYRLSRKDWARFRGLFWADTLVALIISPAIFALVWIAVFQQADFERYKIMYIAIKYTLILVSLRAVLLMGFSFQAVTNLELMGGNKKSCPYCDETIKEKAVKCRYCGSDLTKSPTSPLV